ncbi:MAG: type II secretion system protein GspM [Chloroflexi bacterium]|nr:type II secretion system protein GspM [Chloroflexota bacterium]
MTEEDPELKKKEMYADAEWEPSSLRSTLGRWLRRIIIGLLLLVMLVVVAWFALVGPRAAEISRLQSELSTVQPQVATLETEIEELQTLKAQRSILSLLVDANTARFELARGDNEAAAAALLNTGNTLYQLSLELGNEYNDTIDSLETRLSLARKGMQAETDLSSLNDLEVFISTLQNLLQGLLSQ